MPVSIMAAYARLTGLLAEFGVDLRLPHSKAMGDGLFELRPKEKRELLVFFIVRWLANELWFYMDLSRKLKTHRAKN